jgi:hypothetical protein
MRIKVGNVYRRGQPLHQMHQPTLAHCICTVLNPIRQATTAHTMLHPGEGDGGENNRKVCGRGRYAVPCTGRETHQMGPARNKFVRQAHPMSLSSVRMTPNPEQADLIGI